MKIKTSIYLAFAATSIVAGGLLPTEQTGRAMHGLAFVPSIVAWVLIYIWFKADVAQRRIRTSTTFNGLVIGFSILALPIYFFRSRGVARALKSTLIFYLCLIGWSVVATIVIAIRVAAHAS